MNQPDPESIPALEAFLAQYEKDKAAGGIRPLQKYVDMFPGEMEAIASVYMREKIHSDHALFSLDSQDENRIGPYIIERELGRGGQGEVFLAEDSRLHRKVAVKVMRNLGPGSRAARQRSTA